MATRVMDGHGLDVEVKNYKEDLQQMHRNGTSLAQNCKFLAIEDEGQPQSFISLNKKP